jgi:hypothetical protein
MLSATGRPKCAKAFPSSLSACILKWISLICPCSVRISESLFSCFSSSVRIFESLLSLCSSSVRIFESISSCFSCSVRIFFSLSSCFSSSVRIFESISSCFSCSDRIFFCIYRYFEGNITRDFLLTVRFVALSSAVARCAVISCHLFRARQWEWLQKIE